MSRPSHSLALEDEPHVSLIRSTTPSVPCVAFPVNRTVGSVAEAAWLAATIAAGIREDHVLAVYLDRQGRVLGYVVVAQRAGAAPWVTARAILDPALRAGAAGFFVARRRRGDPRCIPADEEVLSGLRLAAAAETVGITMYDYIVLGHHAAYFSMADGLGL